MNNHETNSQPYSNYNNTSRQCQPPDDYRDSFQRMTTEVNGTRIETIERIRDKSDQELGDDALDSVFAMPASLEGHVTDSAAYLATGQGVKSIVVATESPLVLLVILPFFLTVVYQVLRKGKEDDASFFLPIMRTILLITGGLV